MPANIFLLAIQASLLAQVVPNPEAAQDIFCDTRGAALSLNPSQSLLVRCPADCPLDLPIWGTSQYTDDSAVCIAAIHAGQINFEGGLVSVYQSLQTAAFVASTSNEVSSQNSGQWPASFQFQPAPEPTPPIELDCNATLRTIGEPAKNPGAVVDIRCPQDCLTASVWGTSIYTDDSSVCTAAIHAGALKSEGGDTTVFVAPGQEAYVGTERNGISTRAWGRYPRSFLFATAFTPGDAQVLSCQDNAQGLEDHESPEIQVLCPQGCLEGPDLWGFEIYSDDSSVCRAAIHAGVLGPRGGSARVSISYDTPSLEAKEQNGILSRSWGPWFRSFEFIQADPVER